MGETPQDVGPTGESTEARSVVFTFRARPGQEAALARWAHDIVSAARRYEGNVGAVVIGPDENGNYRVLHHFRDQVALESWLASAQRSELLELAEPLLERPPAVRRTGLETWFRLPSDGAAIVPPPRWKMWVTSVFAIYPLVLVFLAWVSPRINGWPLAVRAAVFPLVLLSLMTYLVMPTLTRVLRPWLSPGARSGLTVELSNGEG
jgi:antibiotic biosynthesis monooxygenase (ABM) superfamily enzyme